MKREHLLSCRGMGPRLALIFFIINFLLVFANLYLSNGYVAKTNYQAGQMTTATSASNTSLSSGAQTLDFRADTSASVVGDSIVVKGVLMERKK